MLHVLALLLSLSLSSYTAMVDHVSASVTLVTNAEGSCSGFVVAPHRVMTADHCVGESMKSDGVEATVVKEDEGHDLALLDVPTDRPILGFQDTPVVQFQQLTAIGHGFGWLQLTVLRVTVMLVAVSPTADYFDGILVQGGYIHGMSGGPVVDDSGLIVGIVQQVNEGAGFGMNSPTMKAFLLGT